MSLFIQSIINSIIEIIIFSAIPFIWWLVTARKDTSFFKWIGLKKPEGGKKTALWTIGAAVAFMLVSLLVMYAVSGVETATSDFADKGLAALPAILVYAALNTGLPAEIVFRGFLLKRFASRFGDHAGNIMQSVLFGLVHGELFISSVGIPKALLITLFTGGIGWLMGYINEKKAGGSIIPSWCIHTAANIFSGICSAFVLFK
ncbi:MAG TPA: CPBP family intramembrane metalloprotease [Bacillota bacterium]|mgnify:FL=1|nr:CPBP family intramembrane metalloprotease [Bacillota bacterium]